MKKPAKKASPKAVAAPARVSGVTTPGTGGRRATVSRATKVTRISAAINLDGTGKYDIHTGIGFLDHMLEQLSRHSLVDIALRAEGDLHIDFHHTTEDCGYVVGGAIAQANGAADDRLVGLERRRPEPVGQDDRPGSLGPVIGRVDEAAAHGAQSRQDKPPRVIAMRRMLRGQRAVARSKSPRELAAAMKPFAPAQTGPASRDALAQMMRAFPDQEMRHG